MATLYNDYNFVKEIKNKLKDIISGADQKWLTHMIHAHAFMYVAARWQYL